MHPIERLRMVARAGREEATLLGRESASALAAFADEPATLVTACRRLVDRQPTCGPVWWVAARVLSAADPRREAWHAGDDLCRDATSSALAAALPDDATVVVLGWPEKAAEALARRGDVHVLVVDALEEGSALAGWLQRTGCDVELVPESGVAAAVAVSSLALVEATALGPTGCIALSGSAAAAAVGRQAGVPVWAVAGEGRVLPAALWEEVARRMQLGGSPWAEVEEVVPLDWVDAVAGPDGLVSVEDALARPTCPPAPELVGPTSR
jgi:hypothetical protein